MDTTYVLPARCKMSVFVDEINMSVINGWGDQASQYRWKYFFGYYLICVTSDKYVIKIVGIVGTFLTWN